MFDTEGYLGKVRHDLESQLPTGSSGALSRRPSVSSSAVRACLRNQMCNTANNSCATVNMRTVQIGKRRRESSRTRSEQGHEMHKGTKHRLVLFWEGLLESWSNKVCRARSPGDLTGRRNHHENCFADPYLNLPVRLHCEHRRKSRSYGKACHASQQLWRAR